MSQLDKAIGARLKTLVDALITLYNNKNEGKKMTNSAFAKSLGINEAHFTRMKKGEAGISLESILDISSIYNVRIEWLLTGEKPIFKTTTSDIFSDVEEMNIKIQLRGSKQDIETAKSNLSKLVLVADVLPGSTQPLEGQLSQLQNTGRIGVYGHLTEGEPKGNSEDAGTLSND